jgi:hypothetical protein
MTLCGAGNAEGQLPGTEFLDAETEPPNSIQGRETTAETTIARAETALTRKLSRHI